jgi:hypothetical protein
MRRFPEGFEKLRTQVLRFEADTRTGRGIRNCSILSLFGLTSSPIARSSEEEAHDAKATLRADETPAIDR